jgi:hypothetical protein
VRGQQRTCRRLPQSLQAQLRQSSLPQGTRIPLPNARQQHDRLRLQPPRDKRQHGASRAIQPLGILDDQQQRRAGRRVGEQLQRGQPDQEQIRGGSISHAKGRQQRGTLAGRQTLSPGEDRFQELMQPRKWEVGLCLHARGGQDHHAVLPGPPARRRQQRRLPDTSLTGNHQRATARADAVDQIIEQPELTLATDQGKQVHLAAMIIRPRRPVQGGPCDAEHLASATLRGR